MGAHPLAIGRSEGDKTEAELFAEFAGWDGQRKFSDCLIDDHLGDRDGRDHDVVLGGFEDALYLDT